MSKLSVYVTAVRATVREAGGSSTYDMGKEPYETFVRRALRRYSIDKPKIKTAEITGSGTRYITVNSTNLPGYVEVISDIKTIEAISPTISNNDRPNYIERDDWDYYRSASLLYIYLRRHQPSSSDTIRVTYTIPHTINELDSETSDTVPVVDFEAIIYWAANETLLALAGKTAGSSDPTLRQDVVNYRSKSAEYRALAKEYRERYNEWITQPLKAASQVRDIDFGFGFADNQPWLTHRSYGSRN